MPDAFEIVLKAAQKLIDAVSYDVNGINGRGGNGGLTSTETIRASDELRMEISRFEQARRGRSAELSPGE